MQKTDIPDAVRIAGALSAYLIGSGFASGLEIMQFFARFGAAGLLGAAAAAALIAFIASDAICKGFSNGAAFDIYGSYLGVRGGRILRAFSALYLFAGLAVMLSGTGAAFNEFARVPPAIGSAAMALFVFAAAVFGLERLVTALGFAGPVIIALTLLTAVLTIAGAHNSLADTLSVQNAPFAALFSGTLYASYNTVAGVLFFTSLGIGAKNLRTARLGALWGALAVGLATAVMVCAFLTRFSKVATLAIPSLYLARCISPALGAAFAASLFAGIFTTAAPMAWTLCRLVCPDGASLTRRTFTALGVCAAAYSLSLLPFGSLVSRVYGAGGYVGLIYVLALLRSRLRSLRNKGTVQSHGV